MSFPFTDFKSSASVESSDDREVDDGDCFGVSKGEFETELADDEATGSAELVFCRAILRVATDGDISRRH